MKLPAASSGEFNPERLRFIKCRCSIRQPALAPFWRRNGDGVLAFINNHSFLDNPTFRGMRWHLLSTFERKI